MHLPAHADFEHRIPKGLNAFIYIYEGDLEVGGPMRAAPKQAAIILGDGDLLKVRAGDEGTQFIVLELCLYMSLLFNTVHLL